jgi:hypothetical protein
MANSFKQQMPLDCYNDGGDGSGVKFITFNICRYLSVIEGSQAVDKTDLSNLSIPVTDYTHSNITLRAGTDVVNQVQDLKFIIIYVHYPSLEEIQSTDMNIQWSPGLSPTTWYGLTHMMILTGNNEFITIRNNKSFDVRIEIMAAK